MRLSLGHRRRPPPPHSAASNWNFTSTSFILPLTHISDAMSADHRPSPTEEDVEEFLLSCRYGELEEVRVFAELYGWPAVISARDERGNTALHMVCGNGHLGELIRLCGESSELIVETLQYLLPHLPPDFLTVTNEAGTPALHFAIINNQVDVVQVLSNLSEEKGGGLPLLKVCLTYGLASAGAHGQQKNAAGRDALAAAVFAGEGKEQVAGWIEGFVWKAEGGDEEEYESQVQAEVGNVEEDVKVEGQAEGRDGVEEVAKRLPEINLGETDRLDSVSDDQADCQDLSSSHEQ